MTPEIELLLQCCRPARNEGDGARRRRALTAAVDWDHAVTLARAHNVVPLLYRRLGQNSWRGVPPPTSALLKELVRANLIRNSDRLRALFRLLDALAAGAVRALPVKGPVLAAQAYADQAMRAYSDLDIMIAPGDFAAACRLLEREGYEPGIALRGDLAPAFASQETGMPLARGAGEAVELQWNYLPGYFARPCDFDALWGRRRMVPVGNRLVPTLADDETLLLLCLHGLKHGWDRLCLAADLAHFIHGARPALPETTMPVVAGLRLVEMLGLAAPRPGRGDGGGGGRTAEALADGWRRRLYGTAAGPPLATALGREYLAAQPGIAGKLGFLFRLLFTPTLEDWKTSRGSRPGRLLRPVRLVISHCLRRRR